MNGPVKMYKARQIVRHDLLVTLPECMYKMKNIHASNNGGGPLNDHVTSTERNLDIPSQNLRHLPEMSALMDRQREILKQLDELKLQMTTLKSDLGKNATVCSFSPSSRKLETPEIVINASPSHPPYSLLLVKTLIGKHIDVHATFHLHSSVSKLTEQATNFTKSFTSTQSTSSSLKVRLIWKDVGPDMELLISHTPIIGEVNILRYLARMIPELLYENVENTYEIDSVLDLCHCLSRTRTKSDRVILLQNLSKKLGKSEWFCGLKLTIADIAAYSIVKQVALSEITQNMNKWLQKCNSLIT